MADWAVEKDGASSCVSAVLLRVKGSALSSLETRYDFCPSMAMGSSY